MGCGLSKAEEEDSVVSLCRERKRLMKSAVECRYALADAHCRYNQSLYAVAAAIRLFVARHSSPASPFLITACPETTEPIVYNSMFLQQTPSQLTHEAIACKPSDSGVSLDSSKIGNHKDHVQEGDIKEESEDNEEEESDDEEEEVVCEQFYGGLGAAMPSPQRDFGWDFFYPFDGMRTVGINSGFNQSFDDDLRVIREEEGIPELEEAGESEREEKKEVMVNNSTDVGHEEEGEVVEDVRVLSQVEHSSFRMVETPTDGRELLEALKDVEDHFIRAYDSGMDVSKMLEANSVHPPCGLEEIKESSSKPILPIAWHRSASSRSSSRKSFLASSSKSSSTWMEFKNDVLDDYGGMKSGSHSLTLGRLYAWEKKLYEEVKAGEKTRKTYERKCSQLREHDARGDGLPSVDRTRAEIKDLYAGILVAIRSAETISQKIQKLRDEELLPQLVELLHGLMRTWKIMLESHETQNKTMFEVKTFNCSSYGKFCNDSHRLATLQLEAELLNWRTCFSEYVSAQKAYIKALDGWLSKFIASEVEVHSNGRPSVPPYQTSRPALLVICHDWLALLEEMPNKAVISAMKSFGKDIQALWVQQGEEQQQKRKVDELAKELDRRVLALQKAEATILKSKLSEQKSEVEMRHRIENVADRKELLDMFRKKLHGEKLKHQSRMQETQRLVLNGFQTGFSSVFESLIAYSRASLKMYSDLVTHGENAKVEGERDCRASCIEGMVSQVEVNSR